MGSRILRDDQRKAAEESTTSRSVLGARVGRVGYSTTESVCKREGALCGTTRCVQDIGPQQRSARKSK